MLGEIKRRLEMIKRRETDFSRWSNPDSLSAYWDRRAPFAAALCADSRCVCDIGCGNQTLRHLLPRGTKYLPADLTKRTEDTELCDLNSKILPEAHLRQSDTVTLLGVIEYVYDVPWVIRALRSFLGTLIISYNPVDMIKVERREKGWVNDFRLHELARLIGEADYIVRDINLVDPGQVVVRATAGTKAMATQ
jgi:hypothetical protein